VCLPSFTLRATDILVYLFAIFVKKKFRSVSERSNLEAFPTKKDDDTRISPHQKDVSQSTPSMTRTFGLIPDSAKNQSPFVAMQRFFLSKVPAFLSIFAPTGLTRPHVESLGFLIHGGPSFLARADDLATALDLFQNDCEIEENAKLSQALGRMLPTVRELESFMLRNNPRVNSPLAYRPLATRGVDQSPAPKPRVDKPLILQNVVMKSIVESPAEAVNVYLDDCRRARIYICAAVSTLFITHCKDSVIFVGAAIAVHLEFCANVTVVAASRMVHLDASTKCTLYLLTNTRPLLTGSCPKLILAPYNAMYTKFGLDVLCLGINPKLNLWAEPLILGSLGASVFERLPVERFALFAVPFAFANVSQVISPMIPEEYARELEGKRNRLLNLKADLAVIRERDPALYQRLVDQMQKDSSQRITETGDMNEYNWLTQVEFS
jgi:hypothetical protein